MGDWALVIGLSFSSAWTVGLSTEDDSAGRQRPNSSTSLAKTEAPGQSDAQSSWQQVFRQRRDWWSLTPPVNVKPPIPSADRWAAHPIDAFVAHRLEDAGLEVSPPADPESLARRFSLVFIGLPAKPGEIQQFRSHWRRDPESAVARELDRLLSSPHFGERWARHWMDVVRFTETHGNEWNYEVHHAYRYRNYLIRAFNSDLPYNNFIREHIAGDLLPPRWNEQASFNESLIGTAFYRFGEVNHDDCVSLPKIGYDILDNQLDTLTKSFQALTVACARCHDHKIDAVSMRDYYGLLGILKGSRLVAHTLDSPSTNARQLEQLAELKPLIRSAVAKDWLAKLPYLSDYLLAADGKRRKLQEADQLADGLDPKRLQRWIKALESCGSDAQANDPLSIWATVSSLKSSTSLPQAWAKARSDYARRRQQHAEFNSQHYESFADFRSGGFAGWAASGQGLRPSNHSSGDFTVAHQGDSILASVLPAGCFTHRASEKLNGVLQSPSLDLSAKQISLHVLGSGSSAVRLVSNNCQLNYANYKALVGRSWRWVTFAIPANAGEFQTFAELMTKFNNPKYPDQLGTLGGDTTDHRQPWDEIAADPRSFFGITHAVVHDSAEPPKADLNYLNPILQATELSSLSDLAELYESTVQSAVEAWASGRATDEQVRWLDWIVANKLIGNSLTGSEHLSELIDRYRSIEASLARPKVAPGLTDYGAGFDQPLLETGHYAKPTIPVSRRYLQAISPPTESFRLGSGRRALAEAIASPHNPLTARVMVNRIWHHMFGTGLVPTVDDFGRIGELPSHPQLLDHLACWFVEQEWSLKNLIRYIAQSRTFQQSPVVAAKASAIDPDNRLLHHYPSRRLDAESIRDAILTTSGQLDRAMFGRSIQPYRENSNELRRLFAGPLDGHGRRSIYTKINLMEGPRFLQQFNLPGGKVTQGRRGVTNVPTQALSLLNDPFVIMQAESWGKRIVADDSTTLRGRIERIFQAALGRSATESEAERFTTLIEKLAKLHQVEPGQVLSSTVVWKDVAHVVFNMKEFIYIP